MSYLMSVLELTLLVGNDFSELVRFRKLKFGTNDVYVTI